MKINTAYKLFKIKKNKLYPLYVDTKTEIPINKWVTAKEAPQTLNGKVKSKLGELAYRPGFHLTIIPLADHIGKKQQNGQLYQAQDTVWCEVQYCADNDYTNIADQNGKVNRDKCLKSIPKNGFYRYKTNPNAKVEWLITSDIKVIKILTHNEVIKICNKNGYEAQPLEKGE